MLASFTFWSVVRLLMRTVIICTGMCWTRLARAMDGSKEGSENINQEWTKAAQMNLFHILTSNYPKTWCSTTKK